MNSQLSIVAVIDVEAALRDGTLTGNCNLVDNNRYRGSTGEGTDQLVTFIQGNQVANWLVLPADIFNPIGVPYIEKISGEAVDKGIMAPQVFESPEFQTLGLWWGSNINTGVEGLYHYTITFNVADNQMDLIASIYAKRAFSNYETPKELEAVRKFPKYQEFRSYKFIQINKR